MRSGFFYEFLWGYWFTGTLVDWVNDQNRFEYLKQHLLSLFLPVNQSTI